MLLPQATSLVYVPKSLRNLEMFSRATLGVLVDPLLCSKSIQTSKSGCLKSCLFDNVFELFLHQMDKNVLALGGN